MFLIFYVLHNAVSAGAARMSARGAGIARRKEQDE
jgi:hypothetical protein